MRKKLFIILSVIILVILAIFIYTVVISFKVVKQSTDKINFGLKDQLQKIVRIPGPIPPESKSFDTTVYTWEMETNEGEITKVKFVHDTAFNKNSQNFIATLEIGEGQDPSLFNKVLPAVIADKQAVISITDSKRVNLDKNEQIGYEKIELYQIEGRSGQISKIIWHLDKDKIIAANQQLYTNIYKYPPIILKTLYSLQKFIITLFSN